MASPDPDFWKSVSNYLWGVLLVPVGMVWKRLDNSVQKEDFKDFLVRFDKHCENDREVQAKLFDKIDEVKTLLIERK